MTGPNGVYSYLNLNIDKQCSCMEQAPYSILVQSNWALSIGKNKSER